MARHRDRAELAVAVADKWHGRGLGTALTGRLVEHARRTRLGALTASTLTENRPRARCCAASASSAPGAASGVAEYVLAFRAALPAAA